MEISYVSPTPGQLPIVASTPIRDGYLPEKTKFEELIECGFNAAIYSDIKNLDLAFSQIQGLPFKLILSGIELVGGYQKYYPEGKNRCSAFIQKYKDSPKLGGWLILDEPSFSNWYYAPLVPETGIVSKEQIPIMSYINLIAQLDENHIRFVNLAADEGSNWIGDFTDYGSYLQWLNQLYAHQLWSYDYYPNLNNIFKYERFYYYLSKFLQISSVSSRPFWIYSISTAYEVFRDGEKIQFYPLPTAGVLRFTAFSSLAYGAQGIMYWFYAQRNNPEFDVTNATTGVKHRYLYKYLKCAIDENGTRTDLWYDLKSVNNEIKKYQHVFLGCEVEDVVHKGKTIYAHTKEFTSPIGCLRNVDCEDTGVIVSNIVINRGEGRNMKRYTVIVSRNPFASQEITVFLCKQFWEITPSQIPEGFGGQDPMKVGFNMRMESGGFIIFRYEP